MTTLPNEDNLIEGWTKAVYEKVDIIDPNFRHDWTSLALGFAIGAGYTIDLAEQFVSTLEARGLL